VYSPSHWNPGSLRLKPNYWSVVLYPREVPREITFFLCISGKPPFIFKRNALEVKTKHLGSSHTFRIAQGQLWQGMVIKAGWQAASPRHKSG
jgi:hypothetical protein